MAGTVATIGTTVGTPHGYYRHYGWNRWHGPYYGYGYGYPNYNGYGYGAGLAGLATAPLMTGRSVAASGDYCANSREDVLALPFIVGREQLYLIGLRRLRPGNG